MIDLALDNDMLVATGTLMCVRVGRKKEERDIFLIEWGSNALQYSYAFNRNKRKVTNKRH